MDYPDDNAITNLKPLTLETTGGHPVKAWCGVFTKGGGQWQQQGHDHNNDNDASRTVL